MVNFFNAQTQAKRRTSLLIVLFLLAVVGLVVATTLLIGVGFGIWQPPAATASGTPSNLPWRLNYQQALLIGAGVVALIGVVMLFKWLQLRPGGKVIAERLGGVLIATDSTGPAERRLLNVVEEMAIAANMPVPAVYILPDEAGINAFAAGYQTQDAVIGITRGAVEHFNRAELQAVVAHEFSHILNGDMRLNIRLIAVVAGLIVITHVGRIMLRSGRVRSRNSKGSNPLPIIGLGLIVIGAIGVLFGNLIKAAVSRQREYLADAAAVQFTRDPEALAAALKKIGSLAAAGNSKGGGSYIQHPNADESAHLFFGQALSRWFSLMATHPPLKRRIMRLEPHWNGEFPPLVAAPTPSAEASSSAPANKFSALALPVILLEGLHHGAQLEVQLQQVIFATPDSIENDAPRAAFELTAQQRLALVEVAAATLRQQDAAAQSKLLHSLQQRAASASLFEWGLVQLLAQHVQPQQAPKLSYTDAAAATTEALRQADSVSATASQRELLAKAFYTLVLASPQQKAETVNAWQHAIRADGNLSDNERQLLLCFSALAQAPVTQF